MKSILLTLGMAFFLCHAMAQDNQSVLNKANTSSVKETSNSATQQIKIQKISQAESKRRQVSAKKLYESTFNLVLTEKEFHSLITSTSNNLKNWQQVFAKYSEDPSADLEYVHALINGMKAKL